MKKRLLLILLLSLASHCLFAVGDDSTYHRYNPNWTRFYRLGFWNLKKVIDTSLRNFEIYNPALMNYAEREIGNLGYPSYYLEPHVNDASGLDIGIHAYDPYLYNADSMLFYETQRPYSYLSYIMGSQSEQMFSGAHTQNVTSQYNFGFNFLRLGSSGDFQHERTDYFDLNIFQSFNTKNQRYHIDLCTFMNRGVVHLNGGAAVPQDSVYNSSKYITKAIVPVNLDTAMYRYNEYHLVFQQSYGWGNFYRHKVNDTTFKKKFCPHYVVEHRFDFSSVRHIYSDDSSDAKYFPEVLKNAYTTADTLKYEEIANEIDFRTMNEKCKDDSTIEYRKVLTEVFIKHSLYTFQEGNYSQIQNGIAGFEFNSGLGRYDWVNNGIFGKIYSQTTWHLYGDYSLLGYNQGDYATNAFITYHFSGLNIGIQDDVKRYMPSLIQQSYSGNYYEWNNSFTAQTYQRYGFVFGALSNNIKFGYYKILFTDPVYYSYNVNPAQYKGTVHSNNYTLNINFRVNNFHLDNRLVWQKFDNDIFHYPAFYTNNSLYYSGFLFKSALQVKMGFNANYNTSYFANSFEPSTSQFYLQNQIQTGNYIWMDAFVSMKIRSVRVVVKADNILQGLFADGVQTAPGYLMPDRSYKLYVYWMFWN